MNRKRLLLIGILAFAVATVASLVVYRVLRAGLNSANIANTPVVVAATDLQVGDAIDDHNVKVVKMPGTDLPVGAFHSVNEVIGRGVVVPMAASELVLDHKLAGDKAGSGLPSVIPSGMRAVSVKVNDVVSVAGFVLPGTHVDVLATANLSRENDPSQETTTTVLENILVLAAGQKMQQGANGDPQQVAVITLLVNPDDAQKLTLAATEGKIQLALRSPIDLEATNPPVLKNVTLYGGPTAPVSEKKVMAKKGKEKPALPPPTSAYVVEMIRGDKRDVTKF